MRARLAILLMAWSAAAAGQQLGTLFHTPKERELLERLRRGEKVEEVAFTRPDPALTGFVKRSDGKSTVFLDKQPFQVRSAGEQDLIEPGIVERFEPAPLPPPPTQRENSVSEDKGNLSKIKPGVSSLRSKSKEE